MGKRWAKDVVTCEVCKKAALRKDTISIIKNGVEVSIHKRHKK